MNTGLQVTSLAIGGYGVVKGLMAITKIPMLTSTNALLNLNRFHHNAYNLSKTAQNNMRILRGWAKSKGWEKLPNPQGAPEKWGVYNNSKFEWRLRIKPEASFRPGLDQGSALPRFDVRLSKGPDHYFNPFNCEMGDSNVGTHLSLDLNYWQ